MNGMNDPRPSLQQTLRQLRLSGLAQSLEVRLAEAAGNRLSHVEFLELILQDELAVRASRQVERRVRAASFSETKSLDEFDFAFNASIKRKQVHDLASCRFIREKADVLLLGPPGVGKSFLVQAIGMQAIRAGFVVLYRSIFDLARDFLDGIAGGGGGGNGQQEMGRQQEGRTLSKYLKPDLLIIDDMGMKQLPRRSGEYLLEIIMRRHENRSTMMTSNRPLEDWAKLIGDVPAATAILDRFLQHAQILSITGKSYRLRHGVGGTGASGTEMEAPTTGTQTKKEQKGRRSTAGGEGLSPPEDTVAVTPMSSDGAQPTVAAVT
jgi:DNA replication protein DnaC